MLADDAGPFRRARPVVRGRGCWGDDARGSAPDRPPVSTISDNQVVHRPPLDGLSPDARAWALHSEALWSRAHEIAAAHPEVDAGDVYHALRCLELTPAERLRQGLTRGRLRTYAR